MLLTLLLVISLNSLGMRRSDQRLLARSYRSGPHARSVFLTLFVQQTRFYATFQGNESRLDTSHELWMNNALYQHQVGSFAGTVMHIFFIHPCRW